MNEQSVLTIEIIKLPGHEDLPVPSYMTEHAAGMDLYAAVTGRIQLNSGEATMIPTGIAIALPAGYEAQVRPRSGLALRHSVTTLNSPGTIDADYRGEIGVILINHGREPFEITRGMRIAQMVVTRYTKVVWKEVTELSETTRGKQGFGHTGSS